MSKQLAAASASSNFTRKKIEDFSYGLNDIIGKGYSSQVFKGRNDESDDPVAVKVIDLKLLRNEINRTLLESQIEILKELKGLPHILTLHEVYTTKNNTYIITQLCQSDLNKKIKKRLTEQEVYCYMDQLIKGYLQFFQHSIVHRDLKPANLLITVDNQLKIADFGFGVKAEEVVKPSKYNVGSPLYMAPESLKRNEYSYKSDLWAIGIIFFEMLTGDTPWRAKNEKELIKKIQSEKIESIILRKEFSTMSKDFLKRALNSDKSLRLTPEELGEFNFRPERNAPLLDKRLNSSIKNVKYDSYINTALTSPKNDFARSIQKRIFPSQKCLPNVRSENVNMSLHARPGDFKAISGQKQPVNDQNPEQIKKQDKKSVSKLLIAEVHYCRFLFKLLARIKESLTDGLLAQHYREAEAVMENYSKIIKHKITNLKNFEEVNFLQSPHYCEYKTSNDFKKLMKITKEYNDRYSVELASHWIEGDEWSFETGPTNKLMNVLLRALEDVVAQMSSPHAEIGTYKKDIIILDYLMTSRQLLEMLKDGENYERFARKSRIEEIVEGATSEITLPLYDKIIGRARELLGVRGEAIHQSIGLPTVTNSNSGATISIASHQASQNAAVVSCMAPLQSMRSARRNPLHANSIM